MITPSKILYGRIHKEEGKEKIELRASVATREFNKGEWVDFKITSSQHNGQRSAIIDIAGTQVGQVYLNLTGGSPLYHARLKYPFYNAESDVNFRLAIEAVFGEKINHQQLIVDNENFVKHSPLATMSGIPAGPTKEEMVKVILDDPLQYNNHLQQTLTEINAARRLGALKTGHRNHTRMNYEVTVHDELGLCINSVTGEADEFIQPIWMNFDFDAAQVFFSHPLFEGEYFKHPGHPKYRSPSIRLVDNFNSLLPKGTRGRQFWNTALLGAQLTALIDQAYAELKKVLVLRHGTIDKYMLANNQGFGSSLVLAEQGGESVYFEANDEGTVWSVYLGQNHLADIKEGEVGLMIDVMLGEDQLTLRAQIEQLFRSRNLNFA